MIRDLKEVYVRSGRYALLCPLLFAIPIVIEMIQHAAEIAIGFYDGRAAMQATEHHPLRMLLGHIKIISLFLVGYWASRFLAFGDDPTMARRFDRDAIRLSVPVMAWSLFWLVFIQDGPLLTTMAGVDMRTASIVLLATILATMAFEPCLSAWKVATATGNPDIGFARSIRLTRGGYWWALGFSLLVVIPLMVAHYALAFGALGQPRGLVWMLMTVDSMLVGFMGVAMTAGSYVIARRATTRHGVALAGPASASSDTQQPLPA